MKTELYNELRERIVKVVPEITELKFGCKVKIVGGSIFSGRVFDCVDGDMTVQPHPYGEGSLRSNGDSCGSCDFYKGEYEILGRDIQLADVLRAMHTNGDEAYFFLTPDGSFVADEFGDGSTFTEIAKWNLALPLNLQEDAVGEYLLTVIK